MVALLVFKIDVVARYSWQLSYLGMRSLIVPGEQKLSNCPRDFWDFSGGLGVVEEVGGEKAAGSRPDPPLFQTHTPSPLNT